MGRSIVCIKCKISCCLSSTTCSFTCSCTRDKYTEIIIRTWQSTKIEFDNEIMERSRWSHNDRCCTIFFVCIRWIVNNTTKANFSFLWNSISSAQLEYLLLNYFNKSLDAFNMQFCNAANVVQSFVIEAFGYHFSDIKNVFNIVCKYRICSLYCICIYSLFFQLQVTMMMKTVLNSYIYLVRHRR